MLHAFLSEIDIRILSIIFAYAKSDSLTMDSGSRTRIVKSLTPFASFLKGLLHKAKCVLQDYAAMFIRCVVTVLAAFLGERFQKENLFVCPSRAHRETGWAFLLIPGMLVGILTWYIEEIYSKSSVDKENLLECNTSRGEDALRRRMKFLYTSVVWWFWAFLDTDYYSCARLGPKPEIVSAEMAEMFARLEAESQLIACGLLTSLLLVALKFPWRFTAFLPSARQEPADQPSSVAFQAAKQPIYYKP